MNLLAIDTCTEIASVTLMTSESRVSRVLSGIQKSSGHILKLCDEVFQETGL
jgi:tRNA threonylcarbamoyladenosine biosynthesis protein TsaB